jgi:hypothetical protein
MSLELLVYIIGPFWCRLFPKSSLGHAHVKGKFLACIGHFSNIFTIHINLPSAKLYLVVCSLKVIFQDLNSCS